VIEKINGLAALQNLKILALGRNNIKSFAGIESLADTLEELWISYNDIEKTKGVLGMQRLKVLHMSYNKVDDFEEVQKLGKMESLSDFVFVGKANMENCTRLVTFGFQIANIFCFYLGNPFYNSVEESLWRIMCIKKIPRLTVLDGIPVTIDD